MRALSKRHSGQSSLLTPLVSWRRKSSMPVAIAAIRGRRFSTVSLPSALSSSRVKGAMGSHLTIQQLTHCFHLKLLGWVALQPLFIAVGVRRHYERQEHEIVRAWKPWGQFLTL